MKRKIIFLIVALSLLPMRVFATGGFGVSTTSISMYPGDTKTVTITSSNAVGRLNISSSNGGVASVNTNAVFMQNPGSSESITVTAKQVGTATVSVIASDNFATMDEEILAGQVKNISVNVVAKPAPAPAPTPTPTPTTNPGNNIPSNNVVSNNNTNDNKSRNSNVKELSVDGYELVKIDDNNYTLSVPNDVTSININAAAEDSKSKVTGAGVHDVNVGENNIEVIIIAEDGSQNKINIKVTRRDGYYLEDLESVLGNNGIDDINISIKLDTKILAQDLTKIKSSGKTVKFNYYNDEKKLIYSWIIDGSKLDNVDDLVTTVKNDSENEEDILRLSNYADGLFVRLEQVGNLPIGSRLRLFVGDKYKDNSLVNIYGYVKENDWLELVENEVAVENGYIEFDIMDTSDYFVTMSTISGLDGDVSEEGEASSSILLIIVVILTLLVVGLLVAFIVKNKKNKKSGDDDSDNDGDGDKSNQQNNITSSVNFSNYNGYNNKNY